MQQLLVSQIWQHNNTRYRILYISKDLDQVFWIKIEDSKALPECISLEELDLRRADGTATPIEDEVTFKDPADYKEKSIQKWETYCKIINLIEHEEPLIFTNKYFNHKCVEISNQLAEFSRQSVRRIILKYFRNGKTKLSLLPDLNNSGAKGVKVENPATKLGRKNKYTKNNFLINARNRPVLEKGYKKFYLEIEQASLQTAHENFLAVKYPETADGIFENAPSLMQFRKVGEDKFGPEERLKGKRSIKIYNKDLRITSESSKINVIGPGYLWQIDSTKADIELVSHIDRDIPIGSPTLYFVTDVFSHALVGVLVTLEEPSFFTASQAVYNAIQDKEIVIEEANLGNVSGFNFNKSDWNICGLPQAIVADRAEFLKHKSNNIIRDLGISIENPPAYRADLKGIVENHFNVLHAKLRGADSKFGMKSTNHKQRGVRDARLDACLTLNEYYAIIIQSVLDYNNSKPLVNYPRDMDMVRDKVRAIPQQLLEWGIENRSGLLRSFKLKDLRMKFLPIERGALTKDGLKFKKAWYNLPKGHELENTMILTQDKRIYFDVYFNPLDLNEIYIKHEKRIISAQLSESRNPLHAELNIWELQAHQEEEKFAEHNQKDVNRAANINTVKLTKQIIENAKKQQSGKKKAKNLKAKSIRENRKVEKEVLNLKTSVQLENPIDSNATGKKLGKVVSLSNGNNDKPKSNNKTDFFRRLMEDE
jgi:hypothetical protein